MSTFEGKTLPFPSWSGQTNVLAHLDPIGMENHWLLAKDQNGR